MALISNEYIDQFIELADNWLSHLGHARSDIKTGSDAWTVAHLAGITDICYGNTAKNLPGIPDCVDAHIKTALTKVFPNAVFNDKYSY